MKNIIALAFILASSAAFADDAKNPKPPATVILTQQELQQIVQAEVGAAIAADHARQAAADVYVKVQGAFAPKNEH